MEARDCNLGDVVRDTITGLKGVVIARTEWLNGCWRMVIQPKDVREGKPVEPSTFDVEQLEMVTPQNKKMPEKRTGGDRPNVVQRPSAVRR